MTKVNLKICLLAINMFVGFLNIELPVHGFTYFFLQEIFIFCLLISNNFLYIKDINAFLSRLQIFFLSLLWAFWVCLLAPNINLVSSQESFYWLPLACQESHLSSPVWQLLHITSLPAASGACSGGISPMCVSVQLSEGDPHPPWRWFPPIFVLEFSASHKRVRFSSRFLTFFPSASVFWNTFACHSLV